MANDPRTFQLVTLRSERRRQIFHTHQDYFYFLSLIKKLNSQFSIECHAYALLSNHVKLMVSGFDNFHVSNYLRALKDQFNVWSQRNHPERKAVFSHFCNAKIATAYDQILCMLRVDLTHTNRPTRLHSSDQAFSSYRHNCDGIGSYMLTNCPGYEGLGVNDCDRRTRYREMANSPQTHETFSRIDYQHHSRNAIDYRAPVAPQHGVHSADIRYLDR